MASASTLKAFAWILFAVQSNGDFIDCSGSNHICSDTVIHCQQHETTDCTILCTSCQSTTIYGPPHASLTIHCLGIESCKSVTIDATHSSALNITGCTAQYSCTDQTVLCPSNGDRNCFRQGHEITLLSRSTHFIELPQSTIPLSDSSDSGDPFNVSFEEIEVADLEMDAIVEAEATVATHELFGYLIVSIVAFTSLCIGCALLQRVGPEIFKLNANRVNRHQNSTDLTHLQTHTPLPMCDPSDPVDCLDNSKSIDLERTNMVDIDNPADGSCMMHILSVPEESISLKPNEISDHRKNNNNIRLKLNTMDLMRVPSEKTDVSAVSVCSTSQMVSMIGMEYSPNGSYADCDFVQPQLKAFRGLRPMEHERYPSYASSLATSEEGRTLDEENVDDEMMAVMRQKFQKRGNKQRASKRLSLISLKSPPLPPLDDSGQESSDEGPFSSDDSMYRVVHTP